jgi:glycerophosphoryl diester phosphodiesterase
MKKLLFGILTSSCALTLNAVNNNISPVVKHNGSLTPSRTIQIYGHRGARGLAPEQTIPAYNTALRLGVDYVDMDINMTKDKVLVVTHDLGLNPDITKDQNKKWIEQVKPINSLTLNELEKYDVGAIKPGTQYANFFPDQYKMENTRIPTLKGVIQYVKKIAGDKVGFQIEIKNDPAKPEMSATPKEYAKALYKVLKEEGVINRTEIQAFDWQCLIELQKLNSEIKAAYLTAKTARAATDEASTVWLAKLNPKDFGYSYPKMVKYLGGACWEPCEINLTKKDIDEAHQLGLKVAVWGWPEQEGTEFNTKKIEQLINWGVDGFITDRPDILRGILAARGYNLPKGFSLPTKTQ